MSNIGKQLVQYTNRAQHDTGIHNRLRNLELAENVAFKMCFMGMLSSMYIVASDNIFQCNICFYCIFIIKLANKNYIIWMESINSIINQ